MEHSACPSHCCPKHGCKYSYADCPIVQGLVLPAYPHNNGCEDCEFDNKRPDINPKENAQMLAHMIALCAWRHQKQIDRSGQPYILHTLKVMYLLRRPEDYGLCCIAVGHDLVEDTKTMYEELEVLFTPRIIDGIRCMTKVPGESQEQYEANVISNNDSVLVKLNDIRHNSDLRRLKGTTQKDFERFQKYMKFYERLKRVAQARGLM